MLDGLFMEFTGLFTRVNQIWDIRMPVDGTYYSLNGEMWGTVAVGIVGLLAVSVPFVLLIKIIKFVTGGYV